MSDAVDYIFLRSESLHAVVLGDFSGHPEHPPTSDDPLGQFCRQSCQDALRALEREREGRS